MIFYVHLRAASVVDYGVAAKQTNSQVRNT